MFELVPGIIESVSIRWVEAVMMMMKVLLMMLLLLKLELLL